MVRGREAACKDRGLVRPADRLRKEMTELHAVFMVALVADEIERVGAMGIERDDIDASFGGLLNERRSGGGNEAGDRDPIGLAVDARFDPAPVVGDVGARRQIPDDRAVDALRLQFLDRFLRSGGDCVVPSVGHLGGENECERLVDRLDRVRPGRTPAPGSGSQAP